MDEKIPQIATNVLQTELEFFALMKAEWLNSHSGRVALIKGTELVGWYDDEAKAFEEGARRFAPQPFLVKRVLEREPTREAPAYTLGILRANN